MYLCNPLFAGDLSAGISNCFAEGLDEIPELAGEGWFAASAENEPDGPAINRYDYDSCPSTTTEPADFTPAKSERLILHGKGNPVLSNYLLLIMQESPTLPRGEGQGANHQHRNAILPPPPSSFEGFANYIDPIEGPSGKLQLVLDRMSVDAPFMSWPIGRELFVAMRLLGHMQRHGLNGGINWSDAYDAATRWYFSDTTPESGRP